MTPPDPVGPLSDLVTRWREEAERYERDGALVPAASLLRRVAEEAEAAVRDWRHQELTVAEAAEESGYSPKTLRRMVREGKIPDSRPEGSQGEITVRRRDLPRKPTVERDDALSEAVARHVERVDEGGGEDP